MLVTDSWDENYRVSLRSYNPTLASEVWIQCKDYEIFKEIVDVVTPILEKEDTEERNKRKKE